MSSRRSGEGDDRLAYVDLVGNLELGTHGIRRRDNGAKVEESEVQNRNMNRIRGDDEDRVTSAEAKAALEGTG